VEPLWERRAFHKKSPNYIYNGIDRIDSSIGYILSNCRPCCRTCNVAKSDLSETEFWNWLTRIITFNKNAFHISDKTVYSLEDINNTENNESN
jgi:hypothetical protein